MFNVKQDRDGAAPAMLVDASGERVAIACEFLAYVAARGCSPNTVRAYAHDLARLWRFLAAAALTWDTLTPARASDLLQYLRSVPSKRRGAASVPVLVVNRETATVGPKLSPATVNRALAAISAFYDWTILCDRSTSAHPIKKVVDRTAMLTSGRHRPFLDGISRQQPTAMVLRVKSVRRLPRPLDNEQIDALFSKLRNRRDLSILRLMLDGGLRPGEALGLHLTDIAYGRRRVVVRHREDHPRGVRSKSRIERLVDLHEAVTLEVVMAYIMTERPPDAETPIIFLVGGHGPRRCEALSYAALARLFARACERANIRTRWITLHALHHTHATRMWEAGTRELTLQKRLGHASPESTRQYTRVSDESVVAEYRRALGLDAESNTASTDDHR